MPLADSNVWLALVIPRHTFHTAAHQWLNARSATEPALLCRSTQQAFLRLLTTQAVFGTLGLPAMSNEEAWSIFERYRADARIAWADEPAQLESVWKRLTRLPTPSPKRWMDAYLAAFAICGDHQFVTTDTAFKQFSGLNLLLLPKS